jgi:small RNA 2'-O-methyltransferase
MRRRPSRGERRGTWDRRAVVSSSTGRRNGAGTEPAGTESYETTPLHDERCAAVAEALESAPGDSVLDLGCGTGQLMTALARGARFRRIVGMDISTSALRLAEEAMSLAVLGENTSWSLVQASFTEPDERFTGFAAAVLLETIEHVDPWRLGEVEQAVFGSYRPGKVVITTPNRDYNALHGLPECAMRHPDHRFEWGRAKFRSWARGVASRNAYAVRFCDIGPYDPERGSSTQMATFDMLCGLEPVCPGTRHDGLLPRAQTRGEQKEHR